MKLEHYFLAVVIGAVLALIILVSLDGKTISEQQRQIDYQEEVIQNLRNDLTNTQYYYDEEIYRLKAQLTAYDSVLQDILEEQYNDDEAYRVFMACLYGMLNTQDGDYEIDVDWELEYVYVYRMVDGVREYDEEQSGTFEEIISDILYDK